METVAFWIAVIIVIIGGHFNRRRPAGCGTPHPGPVIAPCGSSERS